MIDTHAHRRRNRSPKPGAFGAAAFMCLVLLALLTLVQVAHTHPAGNDADNCQLCIAMHSAAPVEVTEVAELLIPIGAPPPIVEVRALHQYWHHQLFIRPPPSIG